MLGWPCKLQTAYILDMFYHTKASICQFASENIWFAHVTEAYIHNVHLLNSNATYILVSISHKLRASL